MQGIVPFLSKEAFQDLWPYGTLTNKIGNLTISIWDSPPLQGLSKLQGFCCSAVLLFYQKKNGLFPNIMLNSRYLNSESMLVQPSNFTMIRFNTILVMVKIKWLRKDSAQLKSSKIHQGISACHFFFVCIVATCSLLAYKICLKIILLYGEQRVVVYEFTK